ncbi:MAG: hypothetical protein LBC98_03120 [Prevotellaceae bacterium]|jgi:endonuclease/exonuclease/phosphatase family metal-dependent hydrolase|nr:hypothetical protein [Prevotellaceae bacterium]
MRRISLFFKDIRLIRLLLSTASILILLVAIFFALMTLIDYRPAAQESLLELSEAPSLPSDTVSVLIWNTGYAGLGADMDFFYEGGKQVRTSKEKTLENLDSIKNFLASRSEDFILLQEIDVSSRRSYGIDELSAIAAVLPPYICCFAVNYDVAFVPLPPTNPTGKIKSGLANFSKHVPCSGSVYAYPNRKPWPERIFLPDRSFVVTKFKLRNGNKLVIINTHNSAYDDEGKLRTEEMNYLKQYVIDEYERGNCVIAAGDWNQNPPESDLQIGNEYFRPLAISPDFMPDGWLWISDGKFTNRFLDMPYVEGKTRETLLDFYLVSPNVRPVGVRGIDLNYRHSDHNPVAAEFVLMDNPN